VRRLRFRLRVAWARFARVTEASVSDFFADRCPLFAAAISYYALFAIFPLAILAVVAFGLVISQESAREHVVTFLLDTLPLSRDQGRADLERLLDGVTGNPGALSAIGIGGLIFAASGLMGAVRNGLNVAFEAGTESGRPFLHGKLLDVLLVLGAGMVIGLSLALTVVLRLSADAAGSAVGGTLLQVGELIPFVLSVLVFTILYVVVPERRIRVRDAVVGAVVAGVGYELTKNGFSVYLDHFGNYSAVYGSLGAIVAFLVFVLLAAGVFLFGAEVAGHMCDVRNADEDDLLKPGEPVLARLRDLALSWVRRPRRRAAGSSPRSGS